MRDVDRRSLTIGALVWLAVVVVVSVATWTVIDAAGRDVTARPAGDPVGAGPLVRSTAPAATSSPQRSRTPAATPRTRTPRPTRTTAAAPSVPPSTAPPVDRPTSQAEPRPAQAPAPAAQERTWSGSAGTVTVRCVGRRASLVSATPADGWRMEVKDRGPDRVRVELESRGESGEAYDGDSDKADVRAECLGGSPRFRVDS